MRRAKKHKVKKEKPGTSSSVQKEEERDLTYYMHDRVELMHQVFTLLKPKELKAMAPRCAQNITINELQELCTEELLGISSKRLCAILDGAEPPSDTETSTTSASPDKLETISLDSISSDEEILSEGSGKKKKHRHRRRNKSKTKPKPKSSSEISGGDQSKANPAAPTVLELLELQARARAIRAQLLQEQNADAANLPGTSAEKHASDDEVEIKEEPAEVVEISSEDEKPNLKDLQRETAQSSKKSIESSSQEGQTVHKKIKDPVTTPQAKPAHKIKLNRNKPHTTIQQSAVASASSDKPQETSTIKISRPKTPDKADKTQDKPVITQKKTETTKKLTAKDKQKNKQKKNQKKKEKKKQKKIGKQMAKKDGSDHDEITLELSDSEKMDLLEDLDRKNFDKVSSSYTEDSESSSSSEEDNGSVKAVRLSKTDNVEKKKSDKEDPVKSKTCSIDESAKSKELDAESITEVIQASSDDTQKENSSGSSDKVVEMMTVEDIPIRNESAMQEGLEDQGTCSNAEIISIAGSSTEHSNITKKDIAGDQSQDAEHPDLTEKDNTGRQAEEGGTEIVNITQKHDAYDTSEPKSKQNKKDLSEGELSDRESSEVEASDFKPEVVCISDDDAGTKKGHKKKKNKKKGKKSKKEKKSKESPDFCKDADQNFFEESTRGGDLTSQPTTSNVAETVSLGDEEDVCEILELSSDSSCNEGDSAVLSKEPTKEEIEALSAKIDEFERDEVVTEAQIKELERIEAEKDRENPVENISWKDRYLESKKVKTVLSTSSIFNAIRKKNKELKRKLEEAKKEAATVRPEVIESSNETLEEGSIEHYNTLERCTKYVDTIREETEVDNEGTKEGECKVTKEMEKDAKQLLKMYKKLLKYNDMNRQSNPNKKKKKKQKKNKADKSKEEKDVSVDIGDKIVS